MNRYAFVAVAALRAQQLLAGSTPRLDGQHTAATMAQMEVAEGLIRQSDGQDQPAGRQCRWQL
jgi:DNA-directed RNA polymerase subunit K/omega